MKMFSNVHEFPSHSSYHNQGFPYKRDAYNSTPSCVAADP